jgi:hypothetical protein
MLAIALDAKKPAKQRVAALLESPDLVCESEKNLQSVLGVLTDVKEPVDVRLAALETMQAARFGVVKFKDYRGEYIAALREVATDADPEMRQRSLGLLSRQKDSFAQKKLLEGLRNPAKALVPPEKALQLLGNDPHGDVYAVARDFVKNPPNPLAKREALRLLAADPAAAPVFEKVLRDKGEDAEIRQVAASALHSLNPGKLQEVARDIVLDPNEHKDVQAASLTALTYFGKRDAVQKDDALRKRVGQISRERKGEANVEQTAQQFISKYGA